MANMNKAVLGNKAKKLAFYIGLIVLPVIQFTIFYLFVNFNSIILAFQKFDLWTGETSFVGTANFAAAFKELFTEKAFSWRFKNSMIAAFFTLIVGLPFAVIFSYYIYKKGLMSGTFKTLLYMPNVISSVVLVIIYRYFVELGVPYIVSKLFGAEVGGLYSNPDTMFGVVLFFSVWIGFGTQVLMYLSAMSGINVSLVEAAQLDGITYLKELWHITIPAIYSVIVTFIVVGISGIFNNQICLFSFGGVSVPSDKQTFGYFLYRELQVNATTKAAWPRLSAIGLIFTLFVAPAAFLARFLLNKFGPKED